MFESFENTAGLIRYRVWPGEPVDEFALNMLQQNTPKGVLLLGRETTEEGDWLLLPIAGFIPFNKYILSNIFTKGKLIEAAKTVRNSLEDYMIPTEELVLRPEWTWVHPETGEPVFLVLPTPNAKDLSLSMEEYETLVSDILARERSSDPNKGGRVRVKAKRSASAAESEASKESASPSANSSANRKSPGKPWKQVLREFWNELD